MTVVLDSTSDGAQGIFNRLGAGIKLLDVINTALGTTIPTEVNDLSLLFDGVTDNDIASVVDTLMTGLPATQRTLNSYKNTLRTSMRNMLVEMVDADNPLTSRTYTAALEELIAQMVGASASVDANEPTGSISGSTTGTGNWVVSMLNGSGKTLENAYDEDIIIKCTAVASLGGTFSVKGEAAEGDKLSHNWPKGSGASKTFSSTDASVSNLLGTNGTFEAITTNLPDGWTHVTGTPGTTYGQETSVVYKGSKAFKFTGNGSEQTQVYRALTGLSGLTPYTFNIWCRVSSNPAAGVLTVDLHDGSGVINDAAGNANSFTVDLTTLGTSYVAKSGTFRLPAAVPSTVRLRLRLSTAMSNTHVLYMDHASMVAPTQIYAGGPYLAGFTGATDWAINDTKTLAVTNDYRGKFQTGAFRLFDSKTLLLPSNAAGSETIDDALIA